jgi:CheY-like chemotaxis protein
MRARLPRRVLVVDDSVTVRSVIRKVLQSSRYRIEVDEAGDGKAALEAAAKQKFDVVLLDCNMPGIDGFTTLSTFLSKHSDTKIVMVTATNDTKNADKARAAGAHDVLCKPFYAKDVDGVMNRLHGLIAPK